MIYVIVAVVALVVGFVAGAIFVPKVVAKIKEVAAAVAAS